MNKDVKKEFKEKYGNVFEWLAMNGKGEMISGISVEDLGGDILEFIDTHFIANKELDKVAKWCENHESPTMPEHNIDMPQCWCKPRNEVVEGGGTVTVHNTGILSQEITKGTKPFRNLKTSCYDPGGHTKGNGVW